MAKLNIYVPALKEGKTVQFRPKGNSMQPKIESGQLVTVEPVGDKLPEVGEVLLCKVHGRYWLHLCTAVNGKQYRISNNKGHHNGWTNIKSIYGRVIKVEA